ASPSSWCPGGRPRGERPSGRRRGAPAAAALVDDDGDVAAALEHGRRPAVRARGEALGGRPLVDPGALDVERVDVDPLAVLGVRDRRPQGLRHHARRALRGVLEDAQRRLDRLAADQVDDEPRLLRGDARELAGRACFHRYFFTPGAAAGAGALDSPSTFPLRSPEWPWKVRVGANSPSLWPTAFSVTNTGMNLRPLCTANVKPTMSGVTVERRDQVLTTRFSPDSTMARTFFIR